MKTIKELEKELETAKREENEKKWSIYLDRIKKWCDSNVGKCMLSWTSNSHFILCKVIGYNITHSTSVGAYGQWHPKRWIELTTQGHISCSVPDSRGYSHKIGIDTNKNFNHEFVQVPKKGYLKGKLLVTKLDISTADISKHGGWANSHHAYEIGKQEYENNDYSIDPDYNRALQYFSMFSFFVPEELYIEAFKIQEELVNKTIKWWEKYTDVIKNAPRVTI